MGLVSRLNLITSIREAQCSHSQWRQSCAGQVPVRVEDSLDSASPGSGVQPWTEEQLTQ